MNLGGGPPFLHPENRGFPRPRLKNRVEDSRPDPGAGGEARQGFRVARIDTQLRGRGSPLPSARPPVTPVWMGEVRGGAQGRGDKRDGKTEGPRPVEEHQRNARCGKIVLFSDND